MNRTIPELLHLRNVLRAELRAIERQLTVCFDARRLAADDELEEPVDREEFGHLGDEPSPDEIAAEREVSGSAAVLPPLLRKLEVSPPFPAPPPPQPHERLRFEEIGEFFAGTVERGMQSFCRTLRELGEPARIYRYRRAVRVIAGRTGHVCRYELLIDKNDLLILTGAYHVALGTDPAAEEGAGGGRRRGRGVYVSEPYYERRYRPPAVKVITARQITETFVDFYRRQDGN